MIDVVLLGTGGMMPLPNRWLASAMARIDGHVILFDCGEATQIAAKIHGFGFRTVDLILLTHVHADHIAGLPGFLFSIALADRSDPVTIVGPKGIGRVVSGLLSVVPGLPFEVRLAELEGGEVLDLAGNQVETASPLAEPTPDARGSGFVPVVTCLSVHHWVPCLAYRIDLPRRPALQVGAATALGVPRNLWGRLQLGETVEWEGGAALPEDVLGQPRPGLRIVYCVDTRPTRRLPEFARGADLLISEATFGDPGEKQRAIDRRHMTYAEAAELASAAEVRALWLTHFSPSIDDPNRWAPEARRRFPNTTVGHDGLTTTLRFRDV